MGWWWILIVWLTSRIAGIANAAFTLFIFLLTLPAIATPARGWLKFAGYLVVADALFTLIIGLDLWIITLKTKQEFFEIWTTQPANVQDLLQTTVSSTLGINRGRN
jgi:hypothetical protein